VTVVDVHQHLLPPSFLQVLAARSQPPLLDGDVLVLAAGRFPFSRADHDVEERLERNRRAGIDVALVSLQPTLGWDGLAASEQQELTGAWHEGIAEVGRAGGGALVPLACAEARPGCPGACVAGRALLDLDALAPLADALERSGRFLLVHPGAPAPAPAPAPSRPPWWSALVDYVGEMNASYHAWLSAGVARWPRLTVVFALLAGGAPLLHERLEARGGDPSAGAGTVRFDTSSFGPLALAHALGAVGPARLVLGTDVPVLSPQAALAAVATLEPEARRAIQGDNALALLAAARTDGAGV
jgi:hypothetical protein